jgi:hypothetical protein
MIGSGITSPLRLDPRLTNRRYHFAKHLILAPPGNKPGGSILAAKVAQFLTAFEKEAVAQPVSTWRRIELDGVSRGYRTPRILDQRIGVDDYEGALRQLIITDLGHEAPTLLVTNQLSRPAPQLISRYAQRMLIENGIQNGIDFFHMDALSSAVALKVNCDLQLTLMASSLYRLLASRIGKGYETAKSRHLFHDFIDASATIALTEKEVQVRFQKRVHNPRLIAAGFDVTAVRVPWLGGKTITDSVENLRRGVKPSANNRRSFILGSIWAIC